MSEQEERRRISATLHDLQQRLFSLRFQLGMFGQDLHGSDNRSDVERVQQIRAIEQDWAVTSNGTENRNKLYGSPRSLS